MIVGHGVQERGKEVLEVTQWWRVRKHSHHMIMSICICGNIKVS